MVKTQEQILMEDLQTKLAAMQAENERLKAEASKATVQQRITIKAADYGAGSVSLYGLQRFPLSLHPAQWRVLANHLPAVLKFIDENPNVLRAFAFAHEYALKALGLKTRPAKTDATNPAYEREWLAARDKAMADPKLVPSAR